MKKVIGIILSLVMLFSLLSMQALAADRYTDTDGIWAESAIERWSEYGVIEGYDGKFDPDGTLTRAQMAAVLSRLLALPEAESAGFSDVKETDWYAPYIDRCFAAGIMLGSYGKAMPSEPITREQAIVMMGRALGIEPIADADLSSYTDAAAVSAWAKGYVAAMAKAGIVKGTSTTTVSPKEHIDRASTVTIFDRAIGTYVNIADSKIKAAKSGIILIAADNVKVSGAQKGATVIVSPSAAGVTVNGVAVAAGTTTTAAAEKKDDSGYMLPVENNLTITESKTVDGGTYDNVTIASSVGNGDVTLKGVAISGKLIVQGGGANSIHLESCSVDTIQVNKDTTAPDAEQPRIELRDTPVQTIEAVKPVIIEADTASDVKTVEAKSNVTVQGAATKVETITVPQNVAKVPTINVTAGSVETVEAKSEAKIKGAENTVSNVKVEAPVEVASNAVITVTVTVEVTVTVTGNAPVEIAVAAPVAVSIAAETGDKVEVSTTVETGVDVKVNNAEVAHVHKWTETNRENATCSAPGSVTYTCSVEGCTVQDKQKVETLPKLNHSYGAWIPEVPAGTEDGALGHYHCADCNKDYNSLGEELVDLTIPAIYSFAATADALQQIMNDNSWQGAVLSENITLTETVDVPDGKTLIIPEGKALTNTDTLYVYGTLENNGTINNLHLIDVFGSGTLTNSGTITGSNPDEDGIYGSVLGIEGGATLDNENGTINDCINVADYYFAEFADNKLCVVTGNFDNVVPANFEKIAVAFGAEQIQACLNNGEYEIVIACGTKNGANSVELGDNITIPTEKTLLLKDSVFDGTNTYLNSYLIGEGKTLTLEQGAILVARGEVSIAVNGTIDNRDGFILVGGNPFGSGVFVGSKASFLAALAKGGDIYLLPFADAVGEGEDRVLICGEPISVGKYTHLISLGAEPIYCGGGVAVSSGKTLTLDGTIMVLAADSTISGTVELCNGGVLMVRTPNEAEPEETTELTVAAGGKLVIGEGCNVFSNSERWRIVNNGTIDVYGDPGLATDDTEHYSGSGTVFRNVAEVTSRAEFLAAMNSPVVRQIIFTENVTLDPGDAFQGRGRCYEIPADVTVTLREEEGGAPIFLLQGATLWVNGTLVVNHAFYAYAGIDVPEGEQREDHIINENLISYMKNFADFGRSVYAAVGDRPDPVTQADINECKEITEEEWPEGDEEQAFAFLVKYGGVEPCLDKDDENRIYWPAHESINYGHAKEILGKIWKSIPGTDTMGDMPDSVCIKWIEKEEQERLGGAGVPGYDEGMDDQRCEELLDAFIAALPKVADSTTTGFTVTRESEQVISNKTFTNPITITCSAPGGDDNFGGEIRFKNCEFDADVTVYYNDNCRYRVDFMGSCTFGKDVKVNIVKDNGAKLFRDCRVELGGLPEGAVVEAGAPVDVNSTDFILNGLPVAGGAGIDFDCNADHDGKDYNEVDHNDCNAENYCLRLDIFENGDVDIAAGKSIDLSGSVARLNNAGTITVSGSLKANELNNQCWWDNYENEEENRTAHMVTGCIVVDDSGSLTVSRLNNEECWEGEEEQAQKLGEASFINNGTVIVNACDLDSAIVASGLEKVTVNLVVDDASLPEGESITVKDLVIHEHFYTEGTVIVNGTLTIDEGAVLEIASIGKFTYNGSTPFTDQRIILKTISYQNALINDEEHIFNQSTIEGIEATGTLTSLVLTQPVTISEDTEVDFLVIYQENGEGGSLTVSGEATLIVKCGEITYIGCEAEAVNGTISGGGNEPIVISAAQ